jgi:hypothetical protein
MDEHRYERIFVERGTIILDVLINAPAGDGHRQERTFILKGCTFQIKTCTILYRFRNNRADIFNRRSVIVSAGRKSSIMVKEKAVPQRQFDTTRELLWCLHIWALRFVHIAILTKANKRSIMVLLQAKPMNRRGAGRRQEVWIWPTYPEKTWIVSQSAFCVTF